MGEHWILDLDTNPGALSESFVHKAFDQLRGGDLKDRRAVERAERVTLIKGGRKRVVKSRFTDIDY